MKQMTLRREFGMATPVAGTMRSDIEGEMSQIVARNAGALSASGGSDAKSLVERISAASLQEIDTALEELQSMRAGLLAHNERVRSEIAAFEAANDRVANSLNSISDILARWKAV